MVETAQGQGCDPAADSEREARDPSVDVCADTTGGPPRVLLIGLPQTVAAACADAITAHYGSDTHVESAPAYDPSLSDCDVVLLQIGPDRRELDTLAALLGQHPDLPVLLLSSEHQRDAALEGIRQGAYDNVVTVGNYLTTLPLVIEKNLAIRQTRIDNAALQSELAKTVEQVQVKNTQLEQAVLQLETMASTDPLTGLDNRRSLDRMLEQLYAQADRYTHDLTLLMIDIDDFKQINDTFGHQAGDDVLQMAARVLNANCRKSDSAGRMGGDEFLVILPQTGMATAFKVAKRIKSEFDEALKVKFADAQTPPNVSMSIGAASLRQSKPTSLAELISFADQALYSAKQSEKTPVVAYAKQVAIKVAAAAPDHPVGEGKGVGAGS